MPDRKGQGLGCRQEGHSGHSCQSIKSVGLQELHLWELIMKTPKFFFFFFKL